jgi:hypothetical protein
MERRKMKKDKIVDMKRITVRRVTIEVLIVTIRKDLLRTLEEQNNQFYKDLIDKLKDDIEQ